MWIEIRFCIATFTCAAYFTVILNKQKLQLEKDNWKQKKYEKNSIWNNNVWNAFNYFIQEDNNKEYKILVLRK